MRRLGGTSVLSNSNFVIYVAYALIFAAVFLIGHMLLKEEETRAAQESLEELRNRKASNSLVKWTRPFFTQYIVPLVRGKKFWDKRRLLYRRKIISAGLKDELTPDEFISFKAILIVVFPLAGGLVKSAGVMDLSLLAIFGSGIAGWFYPDFWVKSRITARQDQIRKAMPFIVDLLALSTEAGLDFLGAIQKVVEKAMPSPLVEEFGQVLREVKVGSSRQEALREMGMRVDMREISSFIAVLISAEQMGASIGKTLRQQSEQIRSDRFVRAEKAGAAAAQKLLFPIVFIILPAVMLMIAGPFVIQMFS
jgi:tight adherence protein C